MTRDTETPTDDGTDHDDHDDRDGGAATPPEGTPPAADPDPADPDGPAPGAPTPPDPPTPSDRSAADPEGVLTPADLERVARQVRELDDERVLVPTDGDDPTAGAATDGRPATGSGPRDDRSSGSGQRSRPEDGDRPVTTGAPGGVTGASLDAEAPYAVDVMVRTDHGPAAESFGSNDVRVVFEELLRWYAGRIDPGRDPERVLEVLLAASDLDVSVG
jgi:hypothetical protein